VGDGGVGKSWAFIQLAICVAIGRPWLDVFDVPNPGAVLIVMGEEDRDELHRRLFTVGRAMRLTSEQERLASARIVALPLAGRPAALIESERGLTTETPLMRELRERLDSGEDWRLIVLDPLSRFAGADAEKDNAAATRFVQAVESLVEAPGNPTVLVSHHTRKPPSEAGRKPAGASAANARGASALVAGFRWAAELERLGDERARLSVTKSNYAPWGEPVELVRDLSADGYLRVATQAELAARREEVEEADDAASRALEEKILAALAEKPGLSKARLATQVRAADRKVGPAVDGLIAAGRIVRSEVARYGFQLPPKDMTGGEDAAR
jgi:RecA-family ATPase